MLTDGSARQLINLQSTDDAAAVCGSEPVCALRVNCLKALPHGLSTKAVKVCGKCSPKAFRGCPSGIRLTGNLSAFSGGSARKCPPGKKRIDI